MLDITAIIEHFDLKVSVKELISCVESGGVVKKAENIKGNNSDANNAGNIKDIGNISNTTDSTTNNIASIIDDRKDGPAWPAEALPSTKYSAKTDLKSLSRREEISKITLKSIKPGKLAMLIHCTDLLLIRNVTASDLVVYDGTCVPQSLAHLLNKNAGVLNWLGACADSKYLFRMMTHSVLLKNYNLLQILIESVQRCKLDRHSMKKLVTYKRVCDRISGGVFPFEWLLKDCADSNVNVASDIASMRFCRIIDCLKEMKEIPVPKRISERQKHFVYANAWKYLHETVEKAGEKEGKFGKLYLLL